jgi:hypothetical protein
MNFLHTPGGDGTSDRGRGERNRLRERISGGKHGNFAKR